MKSQETQVQQKINEAQQDIQDCDKKIENLKQLPYLIAAVNEVLEVEKDSPEESDKAVVIKTTNRQTVYLPLAGFVDPEQLKPNDIIGVNKDSYLILDTLPRELDTRIKAMELEERPNVQYSQIGGLDK